MRHLHRSIAITDRSSVGEARRVAVAAAQILEFTEDRCSDIGIVATEAATNILNHAKTGELLICPVVENTGAALHLIAIDSGPGIRDLHRALEDGYSTVGTAGQGLGAMTRLADTLSVYSAPQRGTVILGQFLDASSRTPSTHGTVSIPMKGESHCGDSFVILPGPFRSLYMVVDGLGHGPGASEAAREAESVVLHLAHESPAEIMANAHNALKKTRGAAMSIAVVNHQKQVVTYAGVGNISALLVNESSSRSMVSQNGTLGVVLPRVQEYTYPIHPGTTLVMFSDGLTSRCTLNGYPGLRKRPEPLIAGVLYRDFSRRRDDATVLVASLEGLDR